MAEASGGIPLWVDDTKAFKIPWRGPVLIPGSAFRSKSDHEHTSSSPAIVAWNYSLLVLFESHTGVNGDIYRYISPFFSKISVLGSESIYIPIYIYPHPFRFFLSCGAKSIYIPIHLYIFPKIFAPAARIYIYPHLYISPFLFDFFSSKMDLYISPSIYIPIHLCRLWVTFD